MNTVFSHIVQRRLSHETEDVATEALTFILRSSEAARHGLTELLRTVEPDLPTDLYFRSQQTESNVRPDMWGLDDSSTPRVFIENKFWAGLTENQPVEYLRRLARHSGPSILLLVVPEARRATIWLELERRLAQVPISSLRREAPAGSITYVADTGLGPTLALTSWNNLLAAIKAQLTDEPQHRRDLLQLQALCDTADADAFLPISPVELTHQRTPAFLLQLSAVVQDAVALGVAQGILSTDGLRPSSSWVRIGRYVWFPVVEGLGAWLGVHLRLWRDYGQTPLWLVFSATDFGRAREVRAVLEPWAHRERVSAAMVGDRFVVGIDLVTGEEKDRVVKSIVQHLAEISMQLAVLIEQGT